METATEPEMEMIDFEDEDTLEYAFVDDFENEDDFEDATWEWDGDAWKKVA